jgi:hypothetical protein
VVARISFAPDEAVDATAVAVNAVKSGSKMNGATQRATFALIEASMRKEPSCLSGKVTFTNQKAAYARTAGK